MFKKMEFSPSLLILLMGVFILVFLLFGENSINYYNEEKNEKNGSKETIYLPNVFLTSEKKRDLVFVVPYITLSNKESKTFTVNLEKSYNHLEMFYQVEKNNNCIIKVYFDDYLTSFNKIGENYYKYIEKPLFKDKEKIEIKIECQKDKTLYFKKTEALIKDFVIYGYEEFNLAKINFFIDNLDYGQYRLESFFSTCERGSLLIQVNDCNEYLLDFDCSKKIVYNIPKICLNEGKNTLKLKLLSGEINFKDMKIIPYK